MAEGEESESASIGGHSSMRDHMDNPLVFLLVIGLFVYGLGCFGRAVGNRAGAPGVTSFFGG